MKPCSLCNQHHSMQKVCTFQALAGRVAKLLEANQSIPPILAANKEATTLAKYYLSMVQESAQAITIIEQVISEHPDGEKLKASYMERLDQWRKEHFSQDTEKQAESTEPSMSQESETKSSTGPTNGKPSLQLI